jgi:hypothetical protein
MRIASQSAQISAIPDLILRSYKKFTAFVETNAPFPNPATEAESILRE